MNNTFKQIDLIQGTESWLDYRRSHIMATDSATICEKNPYKTPLQLYKQKTECFEDTVNAAMERGKILEVEAREFLNTKHEANFKSPILESVEYPFMAASLDCLDETKHLLIEVKCPGVKVMQEAIDGRVSEMYIYQCQKQMLVTGYDEMFLFFYQDADVNCTIKVLRDENIIKEIIEKEHEFWTYLVNLEQPPISNRDYIEDMDEETNIIASKLMNAMQTKKHIEKEIEGLKEQLKAKSGDQPTKYTNAHVRCTPYFVEGRVDYKKCLEDLDIDKETIEQYKKGKTLQYKFSMY